MEEIKRNTNESYKTVYSILASIVEKQKKGEKPKDCCENLLAPHDIEGDTIPILLYSSLSFEPFSVYGNIGHCVPDEYGPFKTSFFRIECLKGRSVVCLSLLRPLDEDGMIADATLYTYRLEKTDFCIEVKLDQISTIQCASPKLIKRDLLTVEQKF